VGYSRPNGRVIPHTLLWLHGVSWFTAFFQFPWREDAWGYSFTSNQPVRDEIFGRLGATMLLMGTSLVLTIIIAVPIGVIAAVKQYSWPDKIISGFATIGYAIPSWLLALGLLILGGVTLREMTGFGFPMFGRQTLGAEDNPFDIAYHLVLPVTALTVTAVAGFSRYLRASMLDVLRADYVRTAKAKGLSEGRVVYKHALRNALLPLITLIGLSLPTLVAGALITEQIFSYPGIGSYTINAVLANDYPVIIATSIFAGFFVIIGNLLADVLYGVADPRIKY
jgi:peptide/nickel transport system permease protein